MVSCFWHLCFSSLCQSLAHGNDRDVRQLFIEDESVCMLARFPKSATQILYGDFESFAKGYEEIHYCL